MKTLLSFIITLFFISGTLFAQQQFENPGFEEWENVVIGEYELEPVNWSSIKTSDLDNMNNLAPIVWQRSEDARTGEYSLQLINVEILSIIATGMITNGRVHADLNPNNGYVFTDINDSQWNSAFSSRPDSVVGWFKSNPIGIDFGTVKVALHTGNLEIPGDESNLVAMAYLELPSGVHDTWTRFSVPFEYYKSINPEFQLTILTSGNGVHALGDSEIWYDDLEFIYNPESIGENKLENVVVYSSNGVINISQKGNDNDEYQVVVSDLMGRRVYENKLMPGSKRQVNNITKGIYVVSFINGNKTISTKVVVD